MWGREEKANGVDGENDAGVYESKEACKLLPPYIGICIGQGCPPPLPAFLSPPFILRSLPFLHGVEESNGFSIQSRVSECIDKL